MFALVPILFFLSGFTALIYQMVWMRELILVFGASMFAISTLLTAFMGGLALGSWFFGKRAERFRNPLFVYAGLELGIGIYAFLVPLLFSSLLPIYQVLAELFDFSFYAFSLVRFLLAVIILLFPTALMGGTLPVLAQRYKNRESVGKGVGLLYAFNTFGAVVGVLGAGFYLLPTFGLQKSVFVAAGLNGLIALLAYVLGKRDPLSSVSEEGEVIPLPEDQQTQENKKTTKKQKTAQRLLAKADDKRRKVLLTVFAVSGFSAMIYEVIWTRILTLILGSTVYSYATMLATYLLGLAIGSFVFSLLLKRFKRPLLLFTLVQGGIALSCFIGEFVFPLLPNIFMEVMAAFHTWGKVRMASKFILSAAVMFIPTLLMGGVFPLVIHLLTSKKEDSKPQALGAIVGRAYAINTLGTIAGSFTVGFILLPELGIQSSLHIAIMINAFLCLALCLLVADVNTAGHTVTNKEGRVWATGGVFAFLVILSVSSPTWDPLMMSSDLFGQNTELKLLYYREGMSSTVTVVQHQTLAKDAHLTLAIDGKANASTTGDMKTQLLVAHLPMLLVPQPAQDVMLIGHGSGITTGSMAVHPISKLITLELEPAVIEGSRYFDQFSHNILDDPRVTLVEDDARNYLLRTDDLYDVIVSEPSHPWRSGSAKLFTQEFFKIGKNHLAPGGVFSQWIHFYGIRAPELKSVIKTFHSVFPNVMIFYTDAGDLIMLGSEEAFEVDRAKITRRMKDPQVAKDLARAGVHSLFDLWNHFLLGPGEIDRYVGDAQLNTDDFTLVEFQTPKSLFEDTISIHTAEMKGAAAMGGNYLFAEDEPAALRAKGAYAMAKGFLRENKLREASVLIAKGQRLDQTAEGALLRGRIRLSEGDRRGAIQAWESALLIDPEHQESLLLLAKLYQSQGAFKKASPLLERIDKKSRIYLRASYYKGLDYYFRGKPLSAIEALLVGEDLSKPFVFYYQNLVYQKLGLEDEAKQALGRFIVGLNTWRRKLETRPKELRALSYWKDVEWRRKVGVRIPEEVRMAALFERVVLNPLNALNSGAGIFLAGFYPEAAQKLTAALDQLGAQAKGSIGYYYLGLSYKRVGRFQEAANAFRNFVKNPALEQNDLRVIEAKKEIERLGSL